ncbi:hypothetical protein ACFLWS_03670 [Chloroflexota bacterium]
MTGTKLYLEQQCSNGCGKSRNELWVKDWEKAEIESYIGSFRPDILIINRDGTNKAIEVKVTHPVEDVKAAFYREQNISWLEVDASESLESLYEGENAWRIDQPLPFAVSKPPLSKWTCDNCRVQLKKEKEAELREQRKEEYRKHNYEEVLYSKMVDFFYPSSRKYREIYYLKKVIRNDKSIGVLVQKKDYVVLFQQNGEINEVLLELAFEATNREVDRVHDEHGALVDNREWLPWVHGTKYAASNFERYPYLFQWDSNERKWVKQKHQNPHPECRHTWIPKDGGGIVCTKCKTIVDSGKSLSGCTHYFIDGLCKWCGRRDEMGFYGEEQKLNSEFEFGNTTPKETHTPPKNPINIGMREGVCVHCGQLTTDWWSFDGNTKTCKCRKCRQEGKY